MRLTPDLSHAKLLAQHRKQLAASGITDAVMRERGYLSHNGASFVNLRELGFNKRQAQLGNGLLIPQYTLNQSITGWQFRPDTPRRNGDNKPIKYEKPGGSCNILDIPKRCAPYLKDKSVPLWITEGSKKADSGLSHGIECIISLSGVWSWRGTISSQGDKGRCRNGVKLNSKSGRSTSSLIAI